MGNRVEREQKQKNKNNKRKGYMRWDWGGEEEKNYE